MKVANVKTRIYLGAFLLTLAIVAGLCIVLAGDSLSLFRSSRTYKARFENTAGLVAGAPVRMGGVEVGRVAAINIEAHGEALAIAATLKIDAPFFELIRSDASVGLDTQGLLGDKFVSLQAGTSSGAMDENATIATRESGGLNQAIEKSNEILEKVNSATGKIDKFASGLPEHEVMKSMAQDFATSAATLRAIISKLGNDKSMLTTLSDPQSKALLQSTLIKLDATLSNAASITEKIDKGQGTLGALVNDRSLYEDLRELLGHRDRGKNARRIFIEAANGEDAPPAPPAPAPKGKK